MADTVARAGGVHVAHGRNERRRRQTYQPHRWRPCGTRRSTSDSHWSNSQWQIRWARKAVATRHETATSGANGRHASHTGGGHVAHAAPSDSQWHIQWAARGSVHVAWGRNERRRRQTYQPHRWRPCGTRRSPSDSRWQIRWATQVMATWHGAATSGASGRHDNHTGGGHAARVSLRATADGRASQWQIRWAARGGGYVAHSRSKRRHNGRANHTGGSHVARAAPLATSNADMVDRAGGSRVPGSHNERRPMGKRSAQHSSTAAQQPRQGRRRRRPGAGTYAGHTSYGTAWAPANADASTASRRPSRRHACVRRPSATAAAAAAETHAAAAAGASTTASASPRQIGRRTMC